METDSREVPKYCPLKYIETITLTVNDSQITLNFDNDTLNDI
jgi:hypothetical protein